jgi:hypothetical protein
MNWSASSNGSAEMDEHKRNAIDGSLATALCGERASEPSPERPKEATEKARKRYRLELEPLPGVANPEYALRQLLRRALRDHGLKCLSVEQLPRRDNP